MYVVPDRSWLWRICAYSLSLCALEKLDSFCCFIAFSAAELRIWNDTSKPQSSTFSIFLSGLQSQRFGSSISFWPSFGGPKPEVHVKEMRRRDAISSHLERMTSNDRCSFKHGQKVLSSSLCCTFTLSVCTVQWEFHSYRIWRLTDENESYLSLFFLNLKVLLSPFYLTLREMSS